MWLYITFIVRRNFTKWIIFFFLTFDFILIHIWFAVNLNYFLEILVLLLFHLVIKRRIKTRLLSWYFFFKQFIWIGIFIYIGYGWIWKGHVISKFTFSSLILMFIFYDCVCASKVFFTLKISLLTYFEETIF